MQKIVYLITLISICLIPSTELSAQDCSSNSEWGERLLRNTAVEQVVGVVGRALRGNNKYDGAFYRNRANERFRQGNFKEAMADYTVAVRYYRSDRRALARLRYQRGLCGYILGAYEEAIQDFSSAIAIRPDVPDAYYFRGKIFHLFLRKTHHAQRDFDQVIRHGNQPTIQKSFAHYFLGSPYRAQSMMITLLSDSRENTEDYANISYNMAGLQALMGNADEAVTHLKEALRSGFQEYEWMRLDPNFKGIHYHRGFQELVNNRNPNSWPLASPRDPIPDPDPGSYPPSGGNSPSAPAYLNVFDLSFQDQNQNNRIDAEETTYLTFNVRNEGRGNALDMELMVEDRNGIIGLLYTDRQRLNDLPPGGEKRVRVQVNGGQDLRTGEADFRIVIRERNGFDSSPAFISVQTFEPMPPKLAVVDHHFTSEVGGKARLGVPINLKLAVQNLGQGRAEDATIRFSVPANVFTAGESEFSLGDLDAGESKIVNFEFFTNRRYDQEKVPVRADLTEKSGRFSDSFTQEVTINQTLEVDSRVVIQAGPVAEVDIDKIRLSSDVDRDLPRTRMSNPDAVAVVIGNRDYFKQDVPPVDFAHHDALSMKRYLIDVLGYDENNIILLANASQADFNGTFGTNESHKARLFNLVKESRSDVFIYYSGHGAPDVEKEEGYFVPVDCDPTLVAFNGYSIQTFYQNLAKIPYRSLTVVLDACFSGASDKGTLMPYTSLARIKTQSRDILNDPNAMILTSASGDQVSTWYPEQYHSLFTYYFLRGLKGAANTDRNSELSLGELKTYLTDKVPYMARRLRNRTQTPEIYGRESNIVISY